MAPPIVQDAPALALVDRPLELPHSLPEHATRAMQRFRCIGSACEDTCCRDFGIDIDRASLDRMRAAAPDAQAREKVVRLVVLGMRPPTGEPARNLVQLNEQGACPMLDPDGACGVHRQHGEAQLSTTCSVFPRTSLAVDDRLEITGSLACPELARLSLLADDGLEQSAPLAPVLPRVYVGKSVDTDGPDLYRAAFSRTRDTLAELFRQEQFTVGARFAFAATLAAEVDGFFRRDAAPVRPAEALLLRRRLEVELDAASSPATLATLNADLAALPDAPPAVVATAAALLGGRLRLTHAPRFGALVRAALGSLGTDETLSTFDAHRASEALRARRGALESIAPGLMDRILGRYARHFLLRDPYTERPSLLAYLHRLGVNLAALRLLWLSSPRLQVYSDSREGMVDAETPGAARAIAAAGIEVVQAFTKAVSHNLEFLNAVHDGEEQPGKIRFGTLILLAKFV